MSCFSGGKTPAKSLNLQLHSTNSIMLKRLLLPILFICYSIPGFSQFPDYLSAFRIAGGNDDTGEFVKVDAAGNIYVAGTFGAACDFDPGLGSSTLSPLGTKDIYLAKYTSTGNLIWKQYIGGPTEFLNAMNIDAFGNIIIAGDFYNTMTVRSSTSTVSLTSNGGADAFLVKYDSTGSRVLSFSFGAAGTESIRSVAFDAIGDFYITGEFSSGSVDLDPGTGTRLANNTTINGINPEAFLCKYSGTGNLLWTRVLGN